MKILADENLDSAIVAWLRNLGHDLFWMCEQRSGTSDADVAQIAKTDGRILITRDRDFGFLVIRHRIQPRGVVLLRLRGPTVDSRLAAFQQVWPLIETHLDGHFVVVKHAGIRVRPLL